jgi:hypothetical protein
VPASPCVAIVDAVRVRTEVQRSDVPLPLIGLRGYAEAQDGVRKLDDPDDCVGPVSILPGRRPRVRQVRGSGSTLIARWNSLNLPLANRSGSRCASICARQPRGQQPRRFVRGPSVEWHERASGAGDPHDIGSPAVWRNRRNLDEIRPSRDGFFEAMHDVGHQSRCGIMLQLRHHSRP